LYELELKQLRKKYREEAMSKIEAVARAREEQLIQEQEAKKQRLADKQASRDEKRRQHLQYVEEQARFREARLQEAQENRLGQNERDVQRIAMVNEELAKKTAFWATTQSELSEIIKHAFKRQNNGRLFFLPPPRYKLKPRKREPQ